MNSLLLYIVLYQLTYIDIQRIFTLYPKNLFEFIKEVRNSNSIYIDSSKKRF